MLLIIVPYIFLQENTDELERRSKKYLRGEGADLKVLIKL
jgi:hypothetical protein